MQTPAVCFARLVPFLIVQQPGDEHIFPVGSPVSAVEHISVTCGCSIPGVGACLMDSGGSCRHQTPELEPIRQRAEDVSTPASLWKMFLLVSSPVAPTECACQL